MNKPILIVGPPGSGKTQRAKVEAEKIGGKCISIGFHDLIRPFRPWLADAPDVVIVEEVPCLGKWSVRIFDVRCILASTMLTMELQGREPVEVPAPAFILTCVQDLTGRPGDNALDLDVISLHAHGGTRPGSGQRSKTNPKCNVNSQRYTDAEQNLIESVVGGASVNEFIHDAAVDRARVFADRGYTVREMGGARLIEVPVDDDRVEFTESMRESVLKQGVAR